MVLLVLLAEREEEEGKAANLEPNTTSNIKVSKLPTFNENTSRVSDFITVYGLYIRMKMRDVTVKEQVQ